MNYDELLLIYYVNLINTNLTPSVNAFSFKFNNLKMCRDFIESNKFSKDEIYKVNQLATSIVYLKL